MHIDNVVCLSRKLKGGGGDGGSWFLVTLFTMFKCVQK